MFFHSWASLGRVVIACVAMFIIVVLMLRFVGQQALAEMSGFDVVFVVALGSVVANVAVGRDVPIADAIVALMTLLAVQELVRWLHARNLVIHHLVRQRPALLLWDGHLLEDKLRSSAISADEVRAAIRSAGMRSIAEVRAVVLENNGVFSVVRKTNAESDESAFFGIAIPGRPNNSPEHMDKPPVRAPDDRIP